MKLKLLIGFGLAVAASSCSTISHTSQMAPVDAQVYNLTVADMDVSKNKVSTTVEWKWTPLSSVSIEAQKDNATAELLKEADADVVVEPQYTVKRRGLFRGGSLTVTGYPAKYRNFRAMTPADADMVAALNGNVAVTYPIIGTSNRHAVKPKRKQPKVDKDAKVGGKLLNLVGGLIFAPSSDSDTGGQVGLMYGKYGRRWGWYIKGVYMRCSGDRYDWSNETIGSHTYNGAMLSFGVIKTINRRWNVFLGTGFGTAFSTDDSYNNRIDFDYYPSVPVETGVQWILGSLNVMAGVNVSTIVGSDVDSKCNVNPFVGIGFTF